MKLAIAGGGTGGHVFPAVAVAREWLRRGAEREVLLVGTERGLEARLVPEAGLPFATIPVGGLKGIGGLRLVRNLALLGPAMVESGRILERHRFAAALGVGGYASGPFVLAAALTGVPTAIFEPNAEPGFTNRVLAGMVRRVATAYETTAKRLGNRAVVTGIPVRAAFFEIPPRTHQAPFRILITGGSQGSLVVNRTVIDSLDMLEERKSQLFLVHQSGERDYNAVRVAYARREINAEVVPFLSRMAEEFARADLIVCRAGAITAAEVAAAGRAAIFIPFGAATDSHQLRNAQALEAAGAARVIPEPQLSPQRLVGEITSLLDQPERMKEMEVRARALARPRAVADIVNLLEEVARP
ncbi:MAG TPA: undecaprenyldiphospho-muramoylpentapeptide beta-N-acetylglucosaminyltransferase [Candidatus Acidoferrales bacterium]|nr:undecaprenyldiphospho-muramoylpentapeptide beta-N-acetylglucosaminyltransferase [Candidatus Acidoferrales bacterium]